MHDSSILGSPLLRGAFPAALLVLALPGCSRRPTLPYDVADLAMNDPCIQPVAANCGPPPPALPYDLSVARMEIMAPPPPGLRRGLVHVVVSLPQQRLFAYKDNVLVATSPVSTGKPGHATPAGVFHITEKQVFHRSNRYSNAPMPYMERLTASGIALHAGHLPGYPASHGCIRLPMAFAKRLYKMTSYGSPVTVTKTVVGSARRHPRRHYG
ncbi:L,D-transpeptidase family protein [Sphingomonas sp.]|uniref:L,D-transpeptidase family protein n=1 Tax=Sphingomonas sp. TaxID=28214 RepID=UPI003B009D1C